MRMALSGSANKRLVAALVSSGVRAVGLSGEDAALLAATPVDPERLGYVGAPHRVNVELLWHLLAGGYLPVISPVSRDACAGVTGANALGTPQRSTSTVTTPRRRSPSRSRADELLLVADVPGVMSDGAVIPRLHARRRARADRDGTAAGGMRAKLEAALSALDGGVERVRISDIAAIDDAGRARCCSTDATLGHRQQLNFGEP